MPYDLGNPEWFVTAADADTPPSLVQWAGRFVGVPPGVALPPEGQIDSITISGLQLWGYLRTNQNGNREWVIAGQPNPNVVALNQLPPSGAWTDLAARQVYATIGQQLLGIGVSGSDLRVGLKNLYMAAVADHVAATGEGAI